VPLALDRASRPPRETAPARPSVSDGTFLALATERGRRPLSSRLRAPITWATAGAESFLLSATPAYVKPDAPGTGSFPRVAHLGGGEHAALLAYQVL
jgi:hypothetical protein